ncbi:MAG: c-type cytochrome, partial [Verrucomicrobia bacterium]
MPTEFVISTLASFFGLGAIALAAESAVHMLVPGFTVREVPVNLPNINNLRFAPDGRLTALGYDGRVWLLRDSDGDALEDTAELFWDRPTLIVPVGMAWSTAGLYVSSHGKVSLLRDTDGDGRADSEEIIASGWPPTDVASGGTDAMGVTLDQAGNVYFGLITADYSNPYRIKDGVSHYDPGGVRGTIQRLSRKTGLLETVATGIRVPFALRFNQAGDLFCTDQEGETWCPNGNPLDELNHILPGRHYGFPPRHEKWLPSLISEPPVVAFGPQHESTCGLIFNEPHPPRQVEAFKRSTVKAGAGSRSDANRLTGPALQPVNESTGKRLNPSMPCSPGQGLFGPKWWEGDAFVAGESRGKIWRVRLVKTPHGYVGKAFLIARLGMLTLDLAISPKGDLYVCCHSGLPDWGTGPKGEGRIFKISYTDSKAPQPVVAWAANPTETRVAFDRQLDPSVTNAVLQQQIEFGEFVRGADRYEVLKPPYQVVKQQEATPRGRLEIVAARLDDGEKTLVLTTEPHPQTATYALTVPGVKMKGATGAGETVDVDYDLSGVLALLAAHKPFMTLPPIRDLARKAGLKTSEFVWNDWLPYPSVALTERLTGPSAFLANARHRLRPGTGFAFRIIARPKLPAPDARLRVRSRDPFRWSWAGGRMSRDSIQGSDGTWFAEMPPNASTNEAFFALTWNGGVADATFTWLAPGDSTERPLPPGSLISPWALTDQEAGSIEEEDETAVPLISTTTLALGAGGDFERGRDLFFGDRLKCSSCHRIRGDGGEIGPDLTNLSARDAASVLRDIQEPGASINPDYVGYNVSLKDGNELTGFIRSRDNESILLLAADGRESRFRPTDVKEMRVSAVSLMPAGLLDGVNEEQIRDLLTFLLNEPPKRSAAEVEAVLDAGPNRQSAITNRKLEIVLVASKQDHGPGQHDYLAWQQRWHALLGGTPGVDVGDAWQWPSREQFQSASAIVFYLWNHDWNAERYRQLDEFLERGGGVVLFHSATIADQDPEQLAARIGLASQAQRTK